MIINHQAGKQYTHIKANGYRGNMLLNTMATPYGMWSNGYHRAFLPDNEIFILKE